MLIEPLITEIPALDPLRVFSQLRAHGALFLDSARYHPKLGRYSFIALDPFQTLTYKKGQAQLNHTVIHQNPFILLQEMLQAFSLSAIPDLPPFQGGVAGMFGYELGTYIEKLPTPLDLLHYPELILGFYDVVLAWDHLLNKAWVFSSGLPEKDPHTRLVRAQKRLDWICTLIQKKNKLARSSLKSPEVATTEMTANFDQSSYMAAVSRVIEYIRAGDIFEANLSQRFSTTLASSYSPFDLYQRLRQINPAPFAAFFQYGSYALASASPERFLCLSQNRVEARPIKGTCARQIDAVQDQAAAQALYQSEKDRAENIMIVDLMRNDLSRVCLPHSVVVPQLCEIESFATVHHLVSAIEGKLQPGKNAIDLLKATFPGGSITGAPKIRAMEIIAELEGAERGPYCGSMGYIGFNGAMDLSITIRTFAIHQRAVTFQAGGAITVDSDPRAEYEETLVKASALKRALLPAKKRHDSFKAYL